MNVVCNMNVFFSRNWIWCIVGCWDYETECGGVFGVGIMKLNVVLGCVGYWDYETECGVGLCWVVLGIGIMKLNVVLGCVGCWDYEPDCGVVLDVRCWHSCSNVCVLWMYVWMNLCKHVCVCSYYLTFVQYLVNIMNLIWFKS